MKIVAGGKDTVGDMQRVVQSIPSSYTVWKDGTQAIAECNVKGGTDYTTGTDVVVTQNAFDALPDGGKLFFKEGTYTISTQLNVLKAKHLILEGEGFDNTILKNNALTTRLIALGDGTGAGNDFTGKLIMRNMQLHGNDKNVNLIEILNTTTQPSGMVFDAVHFTACGTGTCLKQGTNNIYAETNNYINTKFSYAGCGTNINLGDHNFYGCIWGYCTHGINILGNGGVNVHGGVFTHDTNDIYLYGTATTFTLPQNFYGVFFEESTDTIVSSTAQHTVNGLNFYGCHFHTAGANIFWFWPILNGYVTFINGNVDAAGGTAISIPAGCKVKSINFPFYVTENSGTSTGTGAQQTIAHGCKFTPTYDQVFLSERSTGLAIPYQSSAPDATNIYVTAVNLKTYNWRVEM
jgi:hypothetical protein